MVKLLVLLDCIPPAGAELCPDPGVTPQVCFVRLQASSDPFLCLSEHLTYAPCPRQFFWFLFVGVYKVTPRSCHRFEQAFYTYDM